MRILIIGPFPDPVNGVSFANATLLRNLKKKSCTVDQINTNTDAISGKQGSSFSMKKVFSFLHTYLGVFKIATTGLVYTTPGQTFFGIIKYAPFFLFAILFRKPYIIHVHGNYLGTEYARLAGLKKKIFRFFVSRASAGIVLSASLRRNFEDLLSPAKVFVAENFVTDDLLENRKELKPGNKLRIIYLSNLMEEKGILDLLDALSLLQERGVPFRATLAGAMELGLEHRLQRKIESLGENVEYLSTISGALKRQKLLEANVFILPTWYTMEGQPISLLEGLASGNVIITTKHAGIPDVISESNGYFVPKQDAAAIAERLEGLTRNLSAELSRVSEVNRNYAAANFTEHRFTEKILQVFRSVLNQGRDENY